MSKGSLFFGHARGKLGQIVLSTVKGQQVARAWQPKVANPRTRAQQIQRAKFANTVKFYRRATSNLFKFAYEDKKKTESDYNAFMRHNVDVATIVNRASYDNIAYPAIGFNWTLAAGSLGELSPSTVGGASGGIRLSQIPLNGTTDDEDITVAQVSQSFMANFGAVNGDFVTFVAIESTLSSINDEPIVMPRWSITQIKVDTTATDKSFLSAMQQQDIDTKLSFTASENKKYITMSGNKSAWFGVVLSRVTPNGVLVSTSTLIGNETANTIVEMSNVKSYRDAALMSWNTKASPILKGSIVQNNSL